MPATTNGKIGLSVLEELRALVGEANVLSEPEQTLAYECDSWTFHRHTPEVVLLVSDSEEIAQVIRVARERGIPFVPRGSGTGLSGGALPRYGGFVVSVSKMKMIRDIDLQNRQALAEPGVINVELSRATSPHGYYFAPDPSSQMVSSVGGNLAENAGGPHCLKYGMTTNHVVGLEVVLPSSEIVRFGSRSSDCPGYDLVGVFVGSEGTLGIATEAVLKLTHLPQAVKTMLAAFPTIKDACDAVSSIIAGGIIPAALEMIDQRSIQMVEASPNRVGLPVDAGAILIIELDGLSAALDPQSEQIRRICGEHSCGELRVAKNDEEREKIWKCRKQAFGAAGRITRDLYLQDVVVPRNRLSDVVVQLYDIADRHSIRLMCISHAGDGNLHPVMLFDRSQSGEEEKILEAAEEMLQVCLNVGGTLTGEHGIGSEKNEQMDLLFSETDLQTMKKLRTVFNPEDLCNPGKILPLRHCLFF